MEYWIRRQDAPWKANMRGDQFSEEQDVLMVFPGHSGTLESMHQEWSRQRVVLPDTAKEIHHPSFRNPSHSADDRN